MRKLPLDLQQQTGQRICIAFNLLEGTVLDIQYLIEIAEQHLSFKEIGMLIDALIVLFLLIILIVDFTHNLFQNILHGNYTAGSAKLIDNNGDMHLVLLKIMKQISNHLGFRHKIGRTHQCLPTEGGRFIEMGQQVLDIQHSPYIVDVLLIDGNT